MEKEDKGQKLFEELLKKVTEKNSWGKNEIIALLKDTWIDVLMAKSA